MAEHESHAPQEATAQEASAGARHGSEHHSFERHGSEDSVEQRHRKILVFAHVGAKKHEMPPDRHAPSSTKRDSRPS